MNVVLDVYLKFPANEFYEQQFSKLRKYVGSVEDIEQLFGVEFSCGDGKFMSDFWKWSDNKQSLSVVVSDEELDKYDGHVCLNSPPRNNTTKELLESNKKYRFTVKYYEIGRAHV